MIALDDAAWGAPWRHIRVGEKLILGMGLVLTALIGPAWPTAPLVAVAAVAATLGPARIPLRTLTIAFAGPLLFILIGSISVAISVGSPPSNAWFTIGPLLITTASALNGLQLFARSSAGTLAVLLIATTTPMVDLLGWVRQRGVPGPLVEVASLIYRLLFVLLDTVVAMHAAQVARLGDAPLGRHSFKRRMNTAANTMGTLLIRSWDRAVRLTDGLAARGIEGDLITLPRRMPSSPRFLAATGAVLGGIWLLTFLWKVLS